MAATDIWPVKADLVIPAVDSYESGGTVLGEKLTMGVVAVSKQVELLTKQPTAGLWRDVRLLGANALLSITLAEHSADVINLLYGKLSADGTTALDSTGTTKLGHVVADADYRKILLRPRNSAKPWLYFPRAYVTEVGPMMYDEEAKHMEACEVVIVATVDPTLGKAFYKGPLASLPALGGGGEA